jgi:hypothetical protein
MTYDIRLFGKASVAVSVLQLQSVFEACRFEVLDGDDARWTQLLVTSRRGEEICLIERADKARMAKEIDWLREELADCRPRSAAHWTRNYLFAARELYGCRYLSFGLSRDFVSIPSSVIWGLQEIGGGGIVHAEGQGFSNEEGYQITWGFSDRARGTRQVAVLDGDGRWQSFEIDLSDEREREAFKLGARPAGAELLEFN